MKPRFILPLIGVLLTNSLITSAQKLGPPPTTRTDNVSESYGSVNVSDPYRWLEDQKSPETRAWIDAENKYTDSVFASIPWRAQIHERLEKLLKVDSMSTPVVRGNRYFYTSRRVGQDLGVIYYREGADGKEQVLVDSNKLTPDHSASASFAGISTDGRLFAYGVRQGGEDETAISFIDMNSHQELADHLPRARYSGVAIKPDGSGFYYSKFGNGTPTVRYHEFGKDIANDEEIFGKGYGPGDIVNPSLSSDGRYLQIHVAHGSSGDRAEIYVKDLKNNGLFVTIVKDMAAGFSGEIVDGHLILRTNWNAPNWRIMDVDLAKPAQENWKEIVPQSGAVIERFSLVGGKLFVSYFENVSARIAEFDLSGKHLGDMKLPGQGNANGPVGQWNSDQAFYTFDSFSQPQTIYKYQISTRKQSEWSRLNVPLGNLKIESKLVWYTSKDGTKIPMSLVYKQGLKLDGQRPIFLTGYGGFNLSQAPGFSALAAYWAERGGVFARPNLRGGGEFGEKWHRAGMLESKQNVFDDFTGAAEWLIKSGYTNPSKIAISGGSNGGLLVGAAVTQRPDLFGAVVCSYPLLDMLRYQKFLVGRFWVPEYGSAEDAQQFPFIYKYSPYQNVVKNTKYPAVLFITGDSDTRVAPLHARKMAALMQASTGSDRPILLHYDTKAGHSGGQPISKTIDNLTDEMAFLLWQLGADNQ